MTQPLCQMNGFSSLRAYYAIFRACLASEKAKAPSSRLWDNLFLGTQFYLLNSLLKSSGMSVAPPQIASKQNAIETREGTKKGGTSDAELVVNISSSRVNRRSSRLQWLGGCRNTNCVDPVCYFSCLIPRQLDRGPWQTHDVTARDSKRLWLIQRVTQRTEIKIRN